MRQGSVGALFLLLAGSVSAACDLAGSYERTQRGLLPASLKLSAAESGIAFELVAYGPRMYDRNPTIGALEGVATSAQGDLVCAALFTSGDDQCSVAFFEFAGGIKVAQFGRCLTFGAEVNASGLYRKKAKL
jgi:hypothetical protein